ncbi:hypothetical protein LguiA_035279 [Lonicera macranthoides]
MAFEIPTDLIRQVQTALRNHAGLSSYNPYDPNLPPLPPVAASIAGLDPSPHYLRCNHCKGKLLSGIQSLICVYCGKQQKRDVPPEPIAFNSTFGFRLLLESLGLDGSETVVPALEESETNRGQRTPKDEITLSKLLDLHVPWLDEPEKTETSVTSRNLEQSESSVTLRGVDFDNYFSGSNNDTLFGASEVQRVIIKQIESTENTEVGVQNNLNLFQNVPVTASQGNLNLFQNVTVTASTPSKDASGDAFSGWEASFQSADTGNQDGTLKSADPFIGSTIDLSSHLDSVFGGGEDLTDGKPNANPAPPPSLVNNWTQNDLWNNVSSDVPQPLDTSAKDEDGRSLNIVNNPSSDNVDWFQDNQWQTNTKSAPMDKNVKSAVNDKDGLSLDDLNNPSSESVDWSEDNHWPTNIESSPKDKNVNSAVTYKDGLSLDGLNNPSSESVDWFQDNQWQTNITSVTKDNKTVNEDEDSFDEWNDFTSSSNAQVPSSSAAVNEQRSEINMFNSDSNFPEVDFGSFSQAGFFSGTSSRQNDSAELMLEDPTLDRIADPKRKVGENTDVVDDSNTSSQQKDDVEILMSQMHDLSFMLESNLSVPPKLDALGSFSHD